MVKLNTGTSVVDYLKSTGKDSSYANRSTLAAQNKITGYTGTAAQNIQLLNALKASQTKALTPKVVAPTPVKTPVKTTPVKTAPKPITPKPTTPKSATPAFDQNAYSQGLQNNVNGMYDAQQASQLAALQANKDKAIGDINLQMGQTTNEAQQNRNQADVVSAQNVQRLRELMASQGLNNSGENVTANVGLQNARQSALNNVNTQEQQAMDNFRQKIADINDPYQTQAIVNDIAAQRSKALYGAQQDAFNNGIAVAGLTGDYNGQRTLAGQGLDWNKTVDTANLTGKYNGQDTYQAKQDAIQNQQWNTTRNDNLAQQSKDNAWRQYQYTHMSATDKAQLAQNASQFGEDKAWEMFQLKYNGELQKSTNAAQIAALTP